MEARARNALSVLPWRIMLALLLALGAPAMAQEPREPRAVSPAPTIDRDRSDRVAPAFPDAPVITTPRPAIDVGASAGGGVLRKTRIEGSSLPPASLDAVTAPFVGQPITTERLKALADAVGAAYARSDVAYYAVMIPPQTLTEGALTIRVTEGAVKQYTLAGATMSTPTRLIEAHIARIMRGAPLRKSVLERSLSLMRDIPGQTVEARIRQLDTSGALSLDLTLSRKQVQISLRFDNDGVSNVVSAFQAQASAQVNGLLRDGDSTRVTGYLPLYPDRYQYYSISHSTPIGSNGMTVTFSGSTVRTRSIDGNLEGRASLAGVSVNYPLIRSYKKNLSLTASLDGVNSDNYFLDIRFGDYRSRAVRAGLSWADADERKGFALALVASQGLDALGARPFPGFSESGFAKVNLQGVAVKPLSKNIYVKTTAYVQYSRDKLPVTERLAIGGRGAGRAFRAGIVTGDSGVAGQLEIGWTPPKVPPKLKGSALFAFVDGGAVRTVARPFYNLPAERISLASVGGGARIAFGGKWSLSIEAAMPVKRPAEGYGRSPRLFAGIGRSF